MGRVRTKVTLIRATQDSEELITSAARLCYAHDAEQVFRSNSKDSGEFVRKGQIRATSMTRSRKDIMANRRD